MSSGKRNWSMQSHAWFLTACAATHPVQVKFFLSRLHAFKQASCDAVPKVSSNGGNNTLSGLKTPGQLQWWHSRIKVNSSARATTGQVMKLMGETDNAPGRTQKNVLFWVCPWICPPSGFLPSLIFSLSSSSACLWSLSVFIKAGPLCRQLRRGKNGKATQPGSGQEHISVAVMNLKTEASLWGIQEK